MYRAYGPPA